MEVMKQVWVPLPGIAWLVRGHELGDLCCPGLCLPQVRPIDNQGPPGCKLCLWICGLGVGERTSRGRFLFTHPNCFSREGSRERLLWLTYTVPWADHRMRESRKTVSGVGGAGGLARLGRGTQPLRGTQVLVGWPNHRMQESTRQGQWGRGRYVGFPLGICENAPS